MRRFIQWCSVICLLLGVVPLAQAQSTYPDRPVRFVVAFPPGGATDTFFRQISNEFQAALGQTETALDHLAALTQRVPDPQYFMAYGTLLESVGRLDEAKPQYRYVAAAITLFAANGYQPDADAILFQVHTGDLDGAISNAETVVKSRPFISTHDAYAWALLAKGRDREALTQIEAALSLG